MGLRAELLKKLEKKRAEITALEIKGREAQVYAQALEDTLKLVPPDEDGDSDVDSPNARELREGTILSRARDAIRRAARPLELNELLVALGRPVDKAGRAALSGSIAAYVRKGEIFTRPASNTFGLVGMEPKPTAKQHIVSRPMPPATFGLDESRDDSGDEPYDLPLEA